MEILSIEELIDHELAEECCYMALCPNGDYGSKESCSQDYYNCPIYQEYEKITKRPAALNSYESC